jgi:D-3-phosphoglycerate dehydrogenase / 2-oxoglutarate reductase
MHNSLSGMLLKIGYIADYQPLIKRKEILEILKDYVGIIIRSKTQLDAEFFSAAPNLRFVGRAGAGMDQIDLEEANRLNISILNAPEGNRDAVGEHVVGQLLCLFNQLHKANWEVRNKIWDREGNRGVELKGKTVALIGYGNNGQATAKKLSGFDCKVLAYDKFRENYSDAYAQEATMSRIFEEAEIVSLHLPLTDISRQMVDDEWIESFKNAFYLVNAARGEIVSLEALNRGLESKKVLGACLDVLENEKLLNLTDAQQKTFEQLTSHQNVIFSPHVAGWTHESYVRINEVLVEKIKNMALF